MINITNVIVSDNLAGKYKVRRDEYRYFNKNRPVRVYFEVKDYNPIYDIFSGERYNRPHNLFRPFISEVIAQAVSQKPDEFFMPGEEKIKARWSQYAGCTCPCSPGFILTNVSSKYNIYVEYEIVPDEKE